MDRIIHSLRYLSIGGSKLFRNGEPLDNSTDEKEPVIEQILHYIEEVEKHLGQIGVRKGIPSPYKSLDKVKEQLREKDIKSLQEIKKSIVAYYEIMVGWDRRFNGGKAVPNDFEI